MKKIYLLVVALFFCCSMQAQKMDTPSFYHPAIHVGGRAGASVSFLDIRPSINQGVHVGGLAGITAQLENGPYAATELSVMYALRGWTETYLEAEDPLSYSCYLHCINIPLMMALYYPIGGFRMGIKAGPSIGAIFAVQQVSSGESFPEEDIQRHALPVKGRFAWGVAAGPYFSYSFGKHRIELDARAYYSFNNLFSARLDDMYARSAEFVAELTLSYLFRVF